MEATHAYFISNLHSWVRSSPAIEHFFHLLPNPQKTSHDSLKVKTQKGFFLFRICILVRPTESSYWVWIFWFYRTTIFEMLLADNESKLDVNFKARVQDSPQLVCMFLHPVPVLFYKGMSSAVMWWQGSNASSAAPAGMQKIRVVIQSQSWVTPLWSDRPLRCALACTIYQTSHRQDQYQNDAWTS